MRALILIAGLLALAACRNNDQTDNTSNVDENLTAENIVSNDVTAIDAVTGDAANMAAESDINDVGAAPLIDDNSTAPAKTAAKPGQPAAKKPAAKPTPKRTPAPAPTPSAPSTAATNSAQ